MVMVMSTVGSPGHAKTASHIVTAEMRANALANVERYEWAKAQQEQAVNAARKYAEMSDEELWRDVYKRQIFDMATKQIEWHDPVIPNVSGFNAMLNGPGDLVFIFANNREFLVFDTSRREIVHQENTEDTFGVTNSQQGPRVFVTSPEGDIYILFRKGIASVSYTHLDVYKRQQLWRRGSLTGRRPQKGYIQSKGYTKRARIINNGG